MCVCVCVRRRPYRCQLVETAEELVEGHHQLLGRALGRQHGEALDVGEQDAAEMQRHGETDVSRLRTFTLFGSSFPHWPLGAVGYVLPCQTAITQTILVPPPNEVT